MGMHALVYVRHVVGWRESWQEDKKSLEVALFHAHGTITVEECMKVAGRAQ